MTVDHSFNEAPHRVSCNREIDFLVREIFVKSWNQNFCFVNSWNRIRSWFVKIYFFFREFVKIDFFFREFVNFGTFVIREMTISVVKSWKPVWLYHKNKWYVVETIHVACKTQIETIPCNPCSLLRLLRIGRKP